MATGTAPCGGGAHFSDSQIQDISHLDGTGTSIYCVNVKACLSSGLHGYSGDREVVKGGMMLDTVEAVTVAKAMSWDPPRNSSSNYFEDETASGEA